MAIKPGHIIILNGPPRAGKSSIVKAVQDSFDGIWMNLGVDISNRATPEKYWPGVGLRPGARSADAVALEVHVPTLYAALYDAIATYSRHGLNVVADIGHHDAYTQPRNILADCAKRLSGLPVLFVGVRCSIEEIMNRRNASTGKYAKSTPEDPVPEPVKIWQEEVHKPGIYDLEVDTTNQSPEDCAKMILDHLQNGPVPTAFEQLAAKAES